MEHSSQFENITALGKSIVKELGYNESVDTLGKWMAHYIAELIQDAESATDENRSEKQEKCTNAILELWKHLAKRPNGKRPMEEFEPIFRSLKLLDPENPQLLHFHEARLVLSKMKEDENCSNWLRMADEINIFARDAIRICMTSAVQEAGNDAKRWGELVNSAGIKDEFVETIEVVTDEYAIPNGDTASDFSVKEIENLLEKLKSIESSMGKISNNLEKRVEKLKKEN